MLGCNHFAGEGIKRPTEPRGAKRNRWDTEPEPKGVFRLIWTGRSAAMLLLSLKLRRTFKC